MGLTGEHPRKAGRPRVTVRLLLYVLLVAAGVFTAWQVHVFLTRRRANRGDTPVSQKHAGPHQPAADGNFASILSNPAAAAGMVAIPATEDILPPPSGMDRSEAWRTPGGWVVMKYHGSADLEDAIAWYENTARQRGWQVLSDRGERNSPGLILQKPGAFVEVVLRKRAATGKIVEILVILRPTGSSAGSQ
jgi:hypothetical protein